MRNIAISTIKTNVNNLKRFLPVPLREILSKTKLIILECFWERFGLFL